MQPAPASGIRPWRRALSAALLLALAAVHGVASGQEAGQGPKSGATAPGAEALRARRETLRAELADNPYQKPLYLESHEMGDATAGEVYAVMGYALGTVRTALASPGVWCQIVILHPNTKRCRVTRQGARDVLTMLMVSKSTDTPGSGQSLDFAFQVDASSERYFKAELKAPDGPLGTHDYRVMLEAVPLDGEQTFLRLRYSYGYGIAGRLGMQIYLSTLGRAKVGFSVAGHEADGSPVYVKGIRGLTERNTMRYFLGVEAYLATASAPSTAQSEQRLRNWYSAISRYPRQLYELSEGEYLAMKRREMAASNLP